VRKDNDVMEYIDAHDEDQCNWMMFVRPATNPAEQNLVAYQHGSDIYFTVIKNVEPRQELKVSVCQLMISATGWFSCCLEYIIIVLTRQIDSRSVFQYCSFNRRWFIIFQFQLLDS